MLIINNKKLILKVKILINFLNNKTPAVTSVEECTKEEIGVGADMAAGNQDINGNWALFVKIIKINKIKIIFLFKLKFKKFKKKPIKSKKKKSPKRLENNVINELFNLIQFL